MLTNKILDWYAKHKRDLPWRKTDDVYEVLVSEIMLQQTQVDRVIPKYLAFLKAFPTAKKLAEAKTGDVLTLWSGLGYNRRALNLQKAAVELARLNSINKTPSTIEELEELPGVGPYTARAVAAFALHHDVVPVDTNIRRIYSRFYFKGKGSLEQIDSKLEVPAGKGTDFGNALMDFGSSVCTAESPQCGKCPLKSNCTAWKAGTPDLYLKIAPPQSKFEGSKRQVRGAILRALHNGPLSPQQLKDCLGNEKLNKKHVEKINDILKEMEKEGMVKVGTVISLP